MDHTTWGLMVRALYDGDEEATRMYCGSYNLVRATNTKKLFRCKGDIPSGYTEVKTDRGKRVYDKDGFLLPSYWALHRIAL